MLLRPLSQGCLYEGKFESHILENQWFASLNCPVFGKVRQSCWYSDKTGLYSRTQQAVAVVAAILVRRKDDKPMLGKMQGASGTNLRGHMASDGRVVQRHVLPSDLAFVQLQCNAGLSHGADDSRTQTLAGGTRVVWRVARDDVYSIHQPQDNMEHV